MAITQEQFDHLVKKLEKFSQRSPQGYRFRVALLAALGYSYIFLILAGLMLGVGLVVLLAVSVRRVNSLIVQLIFLLLVPTWMILRSLWVKISPPQGIRLNRHRVPQVFALVDHLTTQLQAPRFHNILLISEFNMGVMQVPKLGIFGWQENYLIIGLPLLQAFTLEQVKAVLAHEIGHLSGNHSRFDGWIYRLRKTWYQLYDRIHQSNRQGTSILFDRFLGWYFPLFDAYSFVLARQDEYEADRCAVELAGKDHTAEALIATQVKMRFLETEFWSSIYQKVEAQPEPPEDAYFLMGQALKNAIAAEKCDQWIQEALARETTNEDTHPCFRDRLSAIGYLSDRPVLQPAPVEISAAEELLRDTLPEFIAEFNRSWQEAQATPWRQRYAYLAEIRSELDALEKQTEFTDAELWRRAYYTMELQGSKAAMPYLEAVLDRIPDHIAANYIFGEGLLQKGDAAGIDHVERAISQQFDLVMDGCQLMYEFYVQQGMDEKAEQCRDRMEQHYQLLQKAKQERATVTHHDKLKPHTFTVEEVEALRQELEALSNIEEAYLVEKDVAYLPESRFCVLGVVRKRGLFDSSDAAQKLFNQIVEHIEFPTEAYIIVLEGDAALKKKLRSVGQSLILKR